MNKKIYVAAPLFNEMELTRNEEIGDILEKMGYEIYLPQRDGGAVYKLIEKSDTDEDEIEERIFGYDIEAMNECDILLFLMDGACLDEGSCFELGYMFCQNKKCYGYKTDARNFGSGKENLMISKSLKHIFRNKQELIDFLSAEEV